ncbi:metallophosphoesterase 1-like protein isoform X1 [Tanacetum coccineum]|uniref:Metallophosphoesterase 1-like protein isoform X1 n=1 Tax=Tanacetum coccineum TaxID=301880 RepID=A0ABQ4XP58_9ASTR
MVDEALNDMNNIADLDGGSDSGNSNEIRENGDITRMEGEGNDENVLESQDEKRCEGEEMGNNSDKECLDDENDKFGSDRNRKEETNENNADGKNGTEQRGYNPRSTNGTNANNERTYAKMVTKYMKIADNKLNFIPIELNEEGSEVVIFDEALVLELGPWIVNNKPLFLKKWDPTIGMKKVEQTKVPLWVSLVNVPMKAWSIEGISSLASSLGKPMIMDNMTAKRCKLGEGRMDFARVLVEFDVIKGFKERIEIQYRDKNNNKKGSKYVNVEFAWKPDICSHCHVFWHSYTNCVKRVKSEEEIAMDAKRKEELLNQRNDRNGEMINAGNLMGSRRFKDRKQYKDGRYYNVGSKGNDTEGSKGYVWKKKRVNEGSYDKQKINDKEKAKRNLKEGEVFRTVNKFTALNDLEEDNGDLEKLKGRMIVDDMVKYFKEQWEIDRQKEAEDMNGDIENVLENISGIAKDLNVEEWKKKQKAVLNFIKEEKISVCGIVETHVKPAKLSKVAGIAFGGWDWVSNSIHSTSGCRIMIGWDKNKVDLMVVHMTRQVMLVVVEIVKSKQKVFCSFVYASNLGVERRSLWNELRNELRRIKTITIGCPWILMGDFNVTFKMEEHSVGGSRISGEMQEFMECANDMEVEDVNCSGLFFTGIKSPSKPKTSILKKLDRVTVNSDFLDKHGDAHARFLPFLISDHTCCAVKEKLSRVLHEYNVAVTDEEKLFAQKGKVKWLSERDKNTKNNGEAKQIDSPNDMFLKKLSQYEADVMVRDITNAEIKEAIFGIGNDKAPGPDGFTAVFFKRSWDIVGEDSAFVPGILIQDNLLITQELLKGYNRKIGPQRCALKIDIAKAYDTVNWSFLKKILIQYGFHERMIRWIMTCVTSAAFSVCVNGERYRYFKSGRGLRQGDPMSPYLFTLVMEVLTLMVQRRVSRSHQFKFHWGCKDIKLTQLCFGDDLLMLSNGDHKYRKKRILEVMPFTVGKLPMKYLGVPRITKNIRIAECNQLVERVKQKVNDWKNKALSYAGRLQLIASVLASIHIYWASVFLIPKTTVKDIEKALKVDVDDNDSGTWKALLNLRSKIRDSVWKKIGDGKYTNIWFDKWCNESPMCEIIPFRNIYEARLSEGSSVADMIVNRE